jgi:hypothetical protein
LTVIKAFRIHSRIALSLSLFLFNPGNYYNPLLLWLILKKKKEGSLFFFLENQKQRGDSRSRNNGQQAIMHYPLKK